MKLLIFIGILQILRFDFQKFRILETLNYHLCEYEIPLKYSKMLITCIGESCPEFVLNYTDFISFHTFISFYLQFRQ